MKNFLLIILLALSPYSFAGFFLQYEGGYSSESDNAETTSHSAMRNILTVGAQFGSSGQWAIGQNAVLTSYSMKNSSMSSASTLSLTELGPRFQFYVNETRTIYLSIVYNFYAKGTRGLAGQNQTVSGTSLIFTGAYQLKVTKAFYLGLSLNYHQISLSEASTASVKTDISQSYSHIYPALSISFRFK